MWGECMCLILSYHIMYNHTILILFLSVIDRVHVYA